MTNEYKFSICMPTYNGAEYVGEALESILSQSYRNFEIIVSDDCSTDDTLKRVNSFKDKRIRVYRTPRNLGYGDNLKTLKSKIYGDIMFMMAQDDLLTPDALQKEAQAYQQDDDIGAVIRPYYQFDSDPRIPVRHAGPPDVKNDLVVSIFDDKKIIEKIIEASGLLSAISYRVKYMDKDFHEDVFPAHAYPFFSIFKKHKIVLLHDYIVAVRIFSSQARFKSSIYEPSPVETWVKMFNTVLKEKQYNQVKENCIDYAARNHVGLVQIRNYSTYKNLLKEILVLLKYRWINILNPRFLAYCIICLLTPRVLLIKVVDEYKNKVLSKVIKSKIKIQL
ncbi:glycosyltransferase [Candidatus Gottesmanbacteria bacterium]|nr:glycosyltransferase [Candidatus Gottesmanbacteria bacterium]